jgi:cytochrome P450
MRDAQHFDPMSAEFLAQPEPLLNGMRARCVAWRHEGLAFGPAVSFFAHADCKAIYRDFKTFSSREPEASRDSHLGDALSLIGEDPPEHTRLRNAVGKVFTAHVIDGLEPRVQSLCDACFDEVLERDEFDMVEDLAARITVGMIAELVGVPPEDRPGVRNWTRRLAAIEGANLFLPPGDPRLAEMETVTAEVVAAMQDYFSARVDERIAEPRDDILTRLVQSGLERQEVISFAKILVLAGNETTTNLINNTVRLLIDHPDQERVLRERTELAPEAIEESLRVKSPLTQGGRVATRDVEISGEKVREGETVFMWISSANRDERVFERPDEFDVTREPGRHLAFAHGIHACLGSPLARLEGRVFLTTLLRRTRGMQRTRPELPPVPTPAINGTQHQWVRFDPA